MTDHDLPGGAAAVIAECDALTAGFASAGHRLYLVGGIVRDLFARPGDLDPPALDALDLDFTTDARPDAVKAIVGPLSEAMWTQGERFGTIAAHLDGRLVEITTHRAEAYDPDSRKPDVVFADDVLADLSRRDFTVNAMAIELTAAPPRVIDPFDGLDDLRHGRLATPLSPAESFSDDPLRMLRAARFAARLPAVPDATVSDAMASMGDRLQVVSAERIRDELDKLLALPDPAPGLDLLLATGLHRRVLPELRPDVVAAVVACPPAPLVRFAVVLAGAGGDAARRRMRALKRSRHEAQFVTRVVELLGALDGHADVWTAPEVRRFVAAAGPDRHAVAAASAALGGPGASLRRAADELATVEPLDDLGPALDGSAVMAALGIEPGREVGEALAFLVDLRLDEGVVPPGDARRLLREWWAARSSG